MSDPIPLHELHTRLRPVGVYQGPQSFPQHLIDARKMQFSRAASLRELSAEFAFFTPGLLFSRIPNAPDLTAAFIEETRKQAVPFSVSFDRALFSGLDTWDNVLYGLERIHWNDYVSYLGTVALQDTKNRRLWRVRTQTVDLIDPFVSTKIVLDVFAPDELVEISALWLESADGSWYLRSRGQPRPTAIFSDKAVFPDTLRFARALFQERQNPYGDADDPNSDTTFGGRS